MVRGTAGSARDTRDARDIRDARAKKRMTLTLDAKTENENEKASTDDAGTESSFGWVSASSYRLEWCGRPLLCSEERAGFNNETAELSAISEPVTRQCFKIDQ